MLKQTPSQTVGPYFRIGLIYGDRQNDLIQLQTRGTQILIIGCVYDGAGEPVPDAMIEIWQADAQGIYSHHQDPRHEQADPAFRGFGRAENRDGGVFTFHTIKPGRVPAPQGGEQSPHINVRVFARGMLVHAITRLYFSDEDNMSDPILQLVDPDRRKTLIATWEAGHGLPTYRFDIVLQGEGETVFFTP